ncbi:MAG: ribosome maturation factor RimP [Acidobacteria bacterium]|nr:ribosome maturation factor RimP [Acidobacteriota bacterium]
MISTERVDRLRAVVARVAASHGLDIFDVQCRREASGWVVRVVIDRPAPPDGRPEGLDEAVGIEDCQRVSQDFGALLDVEDDLTSWLPGGYTLEVSSPGLDRPLRHEADYRRFAGRLAKIVTETPIDGQSAFAGRLSGIEHGEVLLTEGRRVHRVPLAKIRRGRLDVEF